MTDSARPTQNAASGAEIAPEPAASDPVQPDSVPPEFSAPVDLRALRGGRKRFQLEAGAEERAAIARRLGAPGLERLEGEIELTATKAELRAAGVLRAALTRECVSSLEEMTETVEDAFDIVFLRAAPDRPVADGRADDEDAEGVAEDWDAPEVHEGDIFDLGEFLTQQLALAMDPFPRKPGAPDLAAQYGDGGPVSPFAGLAAKIEEN